MITCLALSVVYVGVVYNAVFIRYFYGYDIIEKSKIIQIEYLSPQRTRLLSVSMIATVRCEPSYKGSYQTVIITKDGKRYEGVPSARGDAERVALRLNPNLL